MQALRPRVGGGVCRLPLGVRGSHCEGLPQPPARHVGQHFPAPGGGRAGRKKEPRVRVVRVALLQSHLQRALEGLAEVASLQHTVGLSDTEGSSSTQRGGAGSHLRGVAGQLREGAGTFRGCAGRSLKGWASSQHSTVGQALLRAIRQGRTPPCGVAQQTVRQEAPTAPETHRAS